MKASSTARMLCCAMLASMSALGTELVPPQVDALPGSASDQAPSAISEQVNPSKLEPMMIEPSAEQHEAAYRRDLADCDSQSAGDQACRDAVDARYGQESGDASASAGKCAALDGSARMECLNGGTSAGQ
jgi:hypothetical protein